MAFIHLGPSLFPQSASGWLCSTRKLALLNSLYSSNQSLIPLQQSQRTLLLLDQDSCSLHWNLLHTIQTFTSSLFVKQCSLHFLLRFRLIKTRFAYFLLKTWKIKILPHKMLSHCTQLYIMYSFYLPNLSYKSTWQNSANTKNINCKEFGKFS